MADFILPRSKSLSRRTVWHFARRLLLALALLSSSAAAEVQAGRVVHVIDGDGLIVIVGDRRVNVRLLHIDAPERAQPYGHQSRQSLIAICGGEIAKLEPKGKDRNGRTLARVTCAGTDANTDQVRRGMAWVAIRYAPAESPLYAIENEARRVHRGLWADPLPVPPWEWRSRVAAETMEPGRQSEVDRKRAISGAPQR